jgi:hypothetical protein
MAMDATNPAWLHQQWNAFTSDPLIIVPPMAIAGFVGWWFQGKTSEAKIAGLEQQISVLDEKMSLMEQRVTFADEQVKASNGAKDEVERAFDSYKAEVTAQI